MSTMHGRCTNTDYCSKADTRQEIEIPAGEPFICPECGRGLSGPGAQASGGNRMPLIAGGAAVVLIGAGVAAWQFMGSSPAPAPQTATASSATAPNAAPAPAPAAQPTDNQSTVLLRLSGDAALTSGLAQALAKGFLAFSGDTDVAAAAPDASGTILVNGNRSGRRESIAILTTTTDAGINALAQGTADLALTARKVSLAEKTRLAALGDLGSPAAEHAVGLDALAVIVSPKSELASISVEQLKAVLDGSIKDWADLGITSADVKLLGATPGKSEIAAAANPDAVATAVAADPNAIAIVPLANIGKAKALPVTGATQAVAPTPANIASGDYPLARKLYVYTAPKSLNPLSLRFAEYATSGSGQKLVASAGFIPAGATTPEPSASGSTAAGSSTAQTALAGLRRIDFEIHFNPSSFVPDTRAMRFIDSLTNILVSEHATPSRMVLAGFADSQGSEEQNLEISRKRAEAVAAILKARGMAPGKVEAFGSQNPIADNATEEGRETNRRVEIYLMP